MSRGTSVPRYVTLPYIHKSVTFTKRKSCSRSFECITGEVSTKCNYKINLCAVYRPPDLSKAIFIKELGDLISTCPKNLNYVMLGDINIDLKKSNTFVTQYLDCLYGEGLECGITQYTRVEKKQNIITKSCIDHIFVRNVNNNTVRTCVINNALADHYITGFKIVDNMPKTPCNNYKFITKLDSSKIETELTKVDWNIPLMYENPNDIVNYIIKKFDEVYENSKISVKIKLGKRYEAPWLSDRITYMCKKRDELLSIWKKDETNLSNRILYNLYRNKTNKHINNVKNNYYKKEICKNFNNCKKMWQIINKLSGKITDSIDDLLIKTFKNNIPILVEDFACEFRNNVKKICTYCDILLLDSKTYNNSPDLSMRIKMASNDVIYSIITHMNDKKSPGCDGIRVKDIKSIKSNITPVITHLINTCIKTSLFPDSQKLGIIRPIYKKGIRSDVNNYRPITILPCIDKIIERYLGNEINKFLIHNSQINKNQHGFQKKRSTTQLLSKFTNEVSECMNNREHVLAVFIDFSKAFDTINYETLFLKLQQNGIQGPLLNLFKNYHTNRFTTVKIAGEYSTRYPTEMGAAQGSITGPLEYILYVNDMCNIFSEGSVYQFADDTCLLVANKDVIKAQEQMQHNYNILCKWAHDVGLVINSQKTKLLHIHSPYLKSPYTPLIKSHTHQCFHVNHINCICDSLELTRQHMYLGLIIDEHLNWRPHIDHVCNKLRAFLSKICILKYKIPFNVLRLMYLSLAESIISYGISSYGRTYKTYLDNIYRLQIRILKHIVPKSARKNHIKIESDLFNYCKILNVFNLFKMSIICEGCDKMDSLVRRERPKQLRYLSYLSTYNLPRYMNVYGSRTWEYLLPMILNELPTDTLESLLINRNKCKTIMKQYFLSNCNCNT
ncbi:hypothetical protein JYU34_004226 [Plutella xylostella]|uniref:Reverse transcriptase domain-containing protein n=1 Tax=Plutella xylostella TaxID=51655 RepID=A0ABQ7QXF5_PLUXY|nr:hypothetical protein JYU34_004226 [Plutella xylostella]